MWWNSSDKHDEIKDELDELEGEASGFLFGKDEADRMVLRATSLLTASIIRLDKTSGQAAAVNIGLTVVILLVGIVQVVIMLRGH